MEWDRISGNWDEWKGRVQERWSRLSADEVDLIGGRREQLVGRIAAMYDLSRDQAERQLRNWERNQSFEEFDEADLVIDDEPDDFNERGQ